MTDKQISSRATSFFGVGSWFLVQRIGVTVRVTDILTKRVFIFKEVI
jgi:hypothetical protein